MWPAHTSEEDLETLNAKPAGRLLTTLLKKPVRIDSVSQGSNFPDPGLMFRGLRWRLPTILLPSADMLELIYSHSLADGMLPLKKKAI